MEKIKLWHDDVRPPPEGWVWAKTNEEARELLSTCDVEECSLDHDLGADPAQGIYAKGEAEENGLTLVHWMIGKDLLPDLITIHSWNPPAAQRMAEAIADAGHACTVAPYEVIRKFLQGT